MQNSDKSEIPCVCEFCEYATPISDDDNVLCRHKGIVHREYHCRRFFYDPLKRVPKPPAQFLTPDTDNMKL